MGSISGWRSQAICLVNRQSVALPSSYAEERRSLDSTCKEPAILTVVFLMSQSATQVQLLTILLSVQWISSTSWSAQVSLPQPGLCLFDNNAYVSAPYMVVSYKAVRGGHKDNYNYYHSQVGITIKCAFGVLVQRWGILRRPLFLKISMRKVTALAMAL